MRTTSVRSGSADLRSVCGGMGGIAAGEVASTTAVHNLLKAFDEESGTAPKVGRAASHRSDIKGCGSQVASLAWK
jgi:serine/threonine protein phosphatase PrpC